LDPKLRALSLDNLAKVLFWPGKIEDASLLAFQVVASGVEDRTIIVDAASILAKHCAAKRSPWKNIHPALCSESRK
jgi:hypothetical protein